jgi:hypothetical protein
MKPTVDIEKAISVDAAHCVSFDAESSDGINGTITTRVPPESVISTLSSDGENALAKPTISPVPVLWTGPNFADGKYSVTSPESPLPDIDSHSGEISEIFPFNPIPERSSEKTMAISISECSQLLNTLRASSSDEAIFIGLCRYIDFNRCVSIAEASRWKCERLIDAVRRLRVNR